MALSRVVSEIFNVEKCRDLEIRDRSKIWHRNRHGYRSAAYDFLLTFHSNHGPTSYRFRDKGQWLKWFCEAGGVSPDEARLEQTPYPFQPPLIWRYLSIK